MLKASLAALVSAWLALGPVVAATAGCPAGPGHEVIALWPAGAPGGERVTVTEQVVERSPPPAGLRDRYIQHVRTPTLVVFRPAHPNGVSLLIAPGGGYRWVVMDKEGYEAADRFAAAGVTAYVLAYRLPGDGWSAGPNVALQDAQRALRLVRARSNGGPVGVMGFSAGGHVAGLLALKWDRVTYAPADAADALSARPDFAVLMYPVATMRDPFAHAGSRAELLGAAPSAADEAAWSLEDMARPDAPPTFLVHAADDTSVPVQNSLQLFAALRAAKVPVELHVFEVGGHGFGLRYAVGKPAAAWPDLVLGWMASHGFGAAAGK